MVKVEESFLHQLKGSASLFFYIFSEVGASDQSSVCESLKKNPDVVDTGFVVEFRGHAC